ncbi:MAG: transglycosylase domain-containing protein [Flavobacteriales bacterium]|nr:transglycosylase domain-containing protein [Flavobacteriales bacterium]
MSKQKKKKKKSLVVWLWFFGLGSIFGIAGLFYSISLGLFGDLPKIEELENPKINLATEIYSSDQEILGTYYFENRSNVKFDEMSPNLINALIATEDVRFLEHSGIDFQGLARAIFYMGKKGGASTVTQQLSKLTFHKRDTGYKRVLQKLKEWIIAAQLERYYTKQEIVAMYFNKVDFVNNAVGIKSAARVYFSTTPDSLKIEEAATFVGMLKNPSLFNPLRRRDTTEFRRNIVLSQMKKNLVITQQEYDSLRMIPLKLSYKRVDHNEGLAPYFREVLRAKMKKWCKAHQKPNGDNYNLYTDGLKIYTTINSKMQEYAEYAVREHIGNYLQDAFYHSCSKKSNPPFERKVTDKQVKKIMTQGMKRSERYRLLRKRGMSMDSIIINFDTPTEMRVFSWKGDIDTVMTPLDSIRYYKYFLQTGFMSMDPHTGYIKAWVGGINYKHFKYDHVKLGKRQVGSTFKPFVYSLAIEAGLSPCKEIPNVQVFFDMPAGQPDWSPRNAGGEYGGMMSLKYGLANSVNTITSWIMKQFGPRAVVKRAQDMGVTSKMDTVPSLCLGTSDISVYEMVGANSTFANKGVWIEPTFIIRVEDKHGNVIDDASFRPEKREVMSETGAYVMTSLMKGVVDGVYNEHKGKTLGSAMRLRSKPNKKRPYTGFRNPIAAKTGTTQNQSDGWFMGITPDLVSGVWVGAEDRSVHFDRLSLGQGANMALPIWAYYMHKVYEDSTLNISQGDFEIPEGGITIELDCDKVKGGSVGNDFLDF